MRMDDMVAYLENRGFDAEKKYIPDERVYDFAISAPGRPTIHSKFKYPENCDPGVRDDLQREFLNELEHEYIRCFGCLGQAAEPNRMFITSARHCGKSLFQKTFEDYIRRNVMNTMDIYSKMSLTIKDVIFNNPATIVFWMDGTKTVVKCQEGDEYDPEKGLAMAISKKALGNKGNYYNEMQKWLSKYDEPCLYPDLDINGLAGRAMSLAELIEKRIAMFKELTHG